MKFKHLHAGVLTGAALLIAAVQPVSADLYGPAYGQESISAYKGLPEATLKYLGGPGGVKVVIDTFYSTVERDNRINNLMDGSSPEQIEAQKTALVQTLLGTPSIAPGTAQSGIRQLTVTQYNALVEDLYLAMDATRVSYHVANNVMGSISAYTPAFVSAFVLGKPSVDQGGLNDKSGVVKVGQPSL